MTDLDNLTNLDKGLEKLNKLLNSYNNWINNSKKNLELFRKNQILNDIVNEKIDEHLYNAIKTYERMKNGLSSLKNKDNDKIRKAFTLANESIKISQNVPQASKVDNFKWRPFQIAFQLLNINI